MSGKLYNNFYDQKEEIEQEYNRNKGNDNADKEYKKNILLKKDFNNDVSETLSLARDILKADKTLPENIRKKGYDLMMAIAQERELDELKKLYADYETDIEELAKEKGVKTKSERTKETKKENEELRGEKPKDNPSGKIKVNKIKVK
jgi:uncharacterized protein (UPF0147 family)